MSSHHFVKEDQEPALLILDDGGMPFEKIQELLEWCPTVMVSRGALAVVLGWGIKIDVVVVEGNLANEMKSKLSEYAPLKVLGYPPGDTPIQTAFQYLMAAKQAYVNVVGGAPEDVWQLSPHLTESLKIVLLTGGTRWSLVQSGRFEKWFPAEAEVLVKPWDQSTRALKVGKDGIVKIEQPGKFWIGERL